MFDAADLTLQISVLLLQRIDLGHVDRLFLDWTRQNDGSEDCRKTNTRNSTRCEAKNKHHPQPTYALVSYLTFSLMSQPQLKHMWRRDLCWCYAQSTFDKDVTWSETCLCLVVEDPPRVCFQLRFALPLDTPAEGPDQPATPSLAACRITVRVKKRASDSLSKQSTLRSTLPSRASK